MASTHEAFYKGYGNFGVAMFDFLLQINIFISFDLKKKIYLLYNIKIYWLYQEFNGNNTLHLLNSTTNITYLDLTH